VRKRLIRRSLCKTGKSIIKEVINEVELLKLSRSKILQEDSIE